MSAWDLYDDLIDAIPRDIVVSRAAQGPRWTRVYTESPSCGMAMTMSATSRPAQMRAEYTGVPLRAIAQLAKSWNFSEASFGMAALNSYYATPSVADEHGFTLADSPGPTSLILPQRRRGKKVAVIGHFPFAPKALNQAADFYMLERSLNEGDYPDSAAEYILPECDYVFITGSAFVNKTAPRLLELSRESFNVVLGPSTP